MMRHPIDFDAYWAAIDDELAATPARPTLEPLTCHSGPEYTVHALRITSIGPYRIFGYFSVPTASGPHPALLETPRHGSVNHVPDHHDRRRYVVLTLMHRGQRRADHHFAASYPGLLAHGVDDPARYVYRGIAADCLRGAEFLAEHPAVDPARIAVAGDDLALITAARRPRFAALRLGGLLLYRAMETRATTDAYPLEELNDHVRANPAAEATAAATLALFDAARHAPRVTATTLITLGDEGTTTGLPHLAPLLEAVNGKVEPTTLTHEGGTDHDRVDAWLAATLGVAPASRFINDIEES
jgi:cephalosporin-C deacetylase